MLPPVHPGVSYLVYALLARVRSGEPPAGRPTLAVVVGAAVPDLLDQPLYYALGLSSTRTLGHSLLAAVPVSLVAVLLARRTSLPDEVGIGFAVGYLVHPAADALWPLLFGAGEELGFLLWPVAHSPDYPSQRSLAAVGDVVVTTQWVELLLLAAALVVWWRDGAPGVRTLREGIGRRSAE